MSESEVTAGYEYYTALIKGTPAQREGEEIQEDRCADLDGYRRAWVDVTMTHCFVVYRRPVKK
jgi:hypothetical protein